MLMDSLEKLQLLVPIVVCVFMQTFNLPVSVEVTCPVISDSSAFISDMVWYVIIFNVKESIITMIDTRKIILLFNLTTKTTAPFSQY